MPSRTSHVRLRPGAAVLEDVDDAQALLVVIEPARYELVDDPLPGMPERRVAQVVPERDGFGQFLVEPQDLGDAPGDLRHLERVREPCPVVVAGGREKHLRLVLETPERLAVDDAIPVALKGGLMASSASGRRRPRESALLAASGARMSRSRCSSCSRMLLMRRRPWSLHAEDVVEEARAVRERADLEELGQRLADIGERAAQPEVDVRSHRRARGEDRDVLPRVIRARRRRVVAVIGSDDQQVARK